ncbi:hypothetical protein THIARS_60116 [Thiomonas delicata]|uniref:Uncharacterized protein n=1 Tax=Thiomonas delicata TaxID=364030 RepID=A0A238D2C3_THIDL|nr:hypothetical protein THIARS_60116 [Thiomonas delicata]
MRTMARRNPADTSGRGPLSGICRMKDLTNCFKIRQSVTKYPGIISTYSGLYFLLMASITVINKPRGKL